MCFAGSGIGISASANSLALNTYFKEKRRIATGFSWTVTALGPIVMPYVITYSLNNYSVQGTVLLFGAFSLHTIACALIFQPVHWHTRYIPQWNDETTKEDINESDKNQKLFSGKFLYNADSTLTPGYEIIDPGTPMLSHANDGWFSSSNKPSLRGSKAPSLRGSKAPSLRGSRLATPLRTPKYQSRRTSTNQIQSNRTSFVNLEKTDKSRKDKQQSVKIVESLTEDCPTHKAEHDVSNEKRERPTTLHIPKAISFNAFESTPPTPKYISDNHSIVSFRKRSNTFNVEKEVLRVASKKLQELIERDVESRDESHDKENENEKMLKKEEMMHKNDDNENEEFFSIWEKIYIFFDLDLLKDYSYINQMVGITIANFSELNFSILTPFVLSDFGYTKPQIAMFMSLLGTMDITVRFFVPFIAGKIGWENRTFFLFGVLGMALGRVGM